MENDLSGALLLQKRSRRHMARLLEAYENLVVPHLPPGVVGDSDKFKGIARDTIKEMTADASDVLDAQAQGLRLNGHALEIRDRLGA